MGSLKEIRNRVRSVKNTQKITRAMKLVAAARLRRAQEAAEASRPYAERMRTVIGTLASSVDPSYSPLFRKEEQASRTLIILLSSDRGLCGGFNSTLFRRTMDFMRRNEALLGEVEFAWVGKKGGEFVRREALSQLEGWETAPALPSIELARALTGAAVERFVAGDFDRVYFAYNQFESALTQTPIFEQLLPLDPEAFEAVEEKGEAEAGAVEAGPDYIYEPSREALLDVLLPQFLDTRAYASLLESQASELGARMTAMDNATNNADDLIESLTLQLNRARQAIITTELSEITAGSEALKG